MQDSFLIVYTWFGIHTERAWTEDCVLIATTLGIFKYSGRRNNVSSSQVIYLMMWDGIPLTLWPFVRKHLGITIYISHTVHWL